MKKAWISLLALVLAIAYPFTALAATWDNVNTAEKLKEAFADTDAAGVIINLSGDIDLYRALEAQYPYAFALHAVTRPNKTIELNAEVSRQARQEQAWEYAKVLTAGSISQTMTAEEKLRALHDTLIRQCEYDVDTAEEDAPDGSAPAFAADGALLDHKAVCAGYGRAYEMLCKAAGIQVIYVASEEMNHGWNAVRLGGTTYYIDCTFDDPIPDRGEYVSDQYFMLTGDELAQTHTWNEAFYEQLLDSLEPGGK